MDNERQRERKIGLLVIDLKFICYVFRLKEALEATRVGFMRSGKILAEGDPKAMVRTFQAETLEDVFYTICVSSEHQNSPGFTENSKTERLVLGCSDNLYTDPSFSDEKIERE